MSCVLPKRDALLGAGSGDEVVGEGTDGVADEGEKDRRKEVVPAGACHFSFAEEDGRDQEFDRDPGDVEDRRGYAGLDLLNCDFAEAAALEFGGECADVAEVFDGPAVTECAVYRFLRTTELTGSYEAIRNDEATAGA